MSELQLLVGLVGALGLALFAGTVAALVTYRRTGAFPGQPGTSARGAADQERQARVVRRRALLGAATTVIAVLVMIRLG